jgi:hypothetical protein
MAELSRDEVLDVLGRKLSDAAVAEIIATGVTKAELAAARDRVLQQHKTHDPGPPLDPGPYAHAVEILDRLRGRGIIGEGGSVLQ